MNEVCPLPECPINPELIEHRVGAVERAVESIAESVRVIADSTSKIVRLEERHDETREGLNRAFSETRDMKSDADKVDDRVRVIEVEMPSLKEVKAQINRAVWGLVGLVGIAIVGLVIIK